MCCLHRFFMPLDNRLNNIIGTTYKDLGLFNKNIEKLCEDCDFKFNIDLRQPLFTVADFFCGSGAMRIAFEQNIGFGAIFSNDNNKYAEMVYLANFERYKHINKDIANLTLDEIPPFHVMVAGYSCKPWSINGKRFGFDDLKNGDHVEHLFRILKAKQPRALLWENVQGLVNHSDGHAFRFILEELDKAGYNIFYQIIPSFIHELPQNRKRVYIVGFRKDLGIDYFDFPEGKKTSKVIEDLFKNDYPTGDYWKREFTSDKFSTRKKGIINVTKLWNGQNGNVISSKGYCNTLLTTGGGEGQKVFVPEKDEIIKLPIIVTARLQGFPEEYNWIVSKTQAYRLIGNAISVNVVRLIAQEIYLMLSSYPPCIVPLINKLKS